VSSPLPGLVELARRGELYPAVILHGDSVGVRQEAAIRLARTLLCERAASSERPCGSCRHCRRIVWPAKEAEGFHPDFAILARDLKTSTSAEATREFVRAAHSAPFEARGQVFAVAEADTLSAEAGDALLKLLEEPGLSAPRHFLLLAPSRLDLAETLRSRSLSVYLGEPALAVDHEVVAVVEEGFLASVLRWRAGEGPLWLTDAARRLRTVGVWEDPKFQADPKRTEWSRLLDEERFESGFKDARAERPWISAATVVRGAALRERVEAPLRGTLFALAESLLAAAPLRLRGISPERILEGLVARHLAA
jgi:hypothetical protein